MISIMAMAKVRHLICPQCAKPFSAQWPRNRKFCSTACMQAAYRDRHREQINEYSRKRRETAPVIRGEINRKYHASDKGQATSKLWRNANKSSIMERLTDKYKTDPHYRALLKSRQKAHAILKNAKHIPYVCNGCDATKRLHAHHKNFNTFNNALANLMWLCHWCHMRLHAEARLGQFQTFQN